MRRLIIIAVMLLLAAPVGAQVALNVNQTHTLSWDWQSDGSPVRAFVFQCQQYRKDVEADARSLTFGSLVETPGRYSGCTLAAKNEAGLSAPVMVPDFEYAYSYKALGLFLLELCVAGAAVSTIAVRYGSFVMGAFARRAASPLALPAPPIILHAQKEQHVHHDS